MAAQRFRCDVIDPTGRPSMAADDDGEWVPHEEHAAETASLRALIVDSLRMLDAVGQDFEDDHDRASAHVHDTEDLRRRARDLGVDLGL